MEKSTGNHENIPNDPKAQTAEKKKKNNSSDKKQYERYRSVIGKKAGKTFEDFQEMKYNNPEQWADIQTKYNDTRMQGKDKK